MKVEPASDDICLLLIYLRYTLMLALLMSGHKDPCRLVSVANVMFLDISAHFHSSHFTLNLLGEGLSFICLCVHVFERALRVWQMNAGRAASRPFGDSVPLCYVGFTQYQGCIKVPQALEL